MDGSMMGGGMAAGWLIWTLVVVALLLSIAALLKYLRGPK